MTCHYRLLVGFGDIGATNLVEQVIIMVISWPMAHSSSSLAPTSPVRPPSESNLVLDSVPSDTHQLLGHHAYRGYSVLELDLERAVGTVQSCS